MGQRFTENQRRAILASNDGYCFRCGLAIGAEPWDVDHIIPVMHGGTDTTLNLAPSHASCNRRHGQSLRSRRLRNLPIAREFRPRRFFGRTALDPALSRENPHNR